MPMAWAGPMIPAEALKELEVQKLLTVLSGSETQFCSSVCVPRPAGNQTGCAVTILF